MAAAVMPYYQQVTMPWDKDGLSITTAVAFADKDFSWQNYQRDYLEGCLDDFHWEGSVRAVTPPWNNAEWDMARLLREMGVLPEMDELHAYSQIKLEELAERERESIWTLNTDRAYTQVELSEMEEGVFWEDFDAFVATNPQDNLHRALSVQEENRTTSDKGFDKKGRVHLYAEVIQSDDNYSVAQSDLGTIYIPAKRYGIFEVGSKISAVCVKASAKVRPDRVVYMPKHPLLAIYITH